LQWNRDHAEPFRIIYEEVRARGQRIDVSDDVVRGGAIALEGLTLLPLRERAAVATSCVLGFSHEEVGRIVGVAPADAADVVNVAIAQLRHAAGLAAIAPERRRQTPAA